MSGSDLFETVVDFAKPYLHAAITSDVIGFVLLFYNKKSPLTFP